MTLSVHLLKYQFYLSEITNTDANKCILRKKHPYDCLSEDKSTCIPMTALWCPSFSNHG